MIKVTNSDTCENCVICGAFKGDKNVQLCGKTVCLNDDKALRNKCKKRYLLPKDHHEITRKRYQNIPLTKEEQRGAEYWERIDEKRGHEYWVYIKQQHELLQKERDEKAMKEFEKMLEKNHKDY